MAGFGAGQGQCEGGTITWTGQEGDRKWAVPAFFSLGLPETRRVFRGLTKPPVTRVCGQTLLVPPILTPGPAQMPEKGACMTALVSLSGNKTL